MRRAFHIHIPKTGGTSLNAMFQRVFGEAFQNHGLTRERPRPTTPIAAAHRTYPQARGLGSDYFLCTVTRDPVERLRSNLEHMYGRREQPQYAAIGQCVAAFIESGYREDHPALCDPAFLNQFDNAQVRYLASNGIGARTNAANLQSALENVKKIDLVATLPTLRQDSVELFGLLGRTPPPMVHKNTGIMKQPLFVQLPPALEPLVRYDRLLYAAIVDAKRPDPG